MLIRNLNADDVETMLDINQTNTPALGDEDRDSMGQLLSWSSIALGCDVADRLVGFCLVMAPGLPYPSSNYRWFCDRYSDFAYLDRVGFSTPFQGWGYGTQLYAEVQRRLDSEWFTLEVNLRPANAGSLRFHERLGFTEVGQQVSTSGKLVSLMAKNLRHDDSRLD